MQRTSYLFLSFFFYCPPKKIRPGKAEQNEKASSLYRRRQLTITKKMKRCVPLRRNLAEKPRGMRLKFVLSQLRTCTHESENMFVFFKSWARVSLVQPRKTRWGLTWVSGQRTSYLFLSFLFYCPPKKIRPGKAEQNEKASSLYRRRQLTITKKMKRCVPLRRNLAEKPRGMRLKFVLSQLRTCTHESENMFVFFKSWARVSLVQPRKTRWGLKVGSVFILYSDPTLAVKDLGTRWGED